MVHIDELHPIESHATLWAPAYELDTQLYLLVKTFYGGRHYYLVCVQFSTQIKHLIKLVSDASSDNPKMLHSIRLMHPMGEMKELKDHNAVVSDCGLPNMS